MCQVVRTWDDGRGSVGVGSGCGRVIGRLPELGVHRVGRRVVDLISSRAVWVTWLVGGSGGRLGGSVCGVFVY